MTFRDLAVGAFFFREARGGALLKKAGRRTADGVAFTGADALLLSTSEMIWIRPNEIVYPMMRNGGEAQCE